MLPVETVALFISASLALAIAPGPDNLFVLMQSALYGRKQGICVSLGLCTGLIFHTAAVALGVAAIIQASPLAFSALKIVGALYLCYLAYQALRAEASSQHINTQSQPTYGQLYLRGVVMNSTNPKVAIFFLALLPQFSDPSRGPVGLQIIALGLLFMLVTIVVFSSLSYFAGSIGETIKNSQKIQNTLNRVAGVIYLLLALRLILSH